MSSTTPKPAGQEEGDARAKAFEQAYKASHPNGTYPPVDLKPSPSPRMTDQHGADAGPRSRDA